METKKASIEYLCVQAFEAGKASLVEEFLVNLKESTGTLKNRLEGKA